MRLPQIDTYINRNKRCSFDVDDAEKYWQKYAGVCTMQLGSVGSVNGLITNYLAKLRPTMILTSIIFPI